MKVKDFLEIKVPIYNGNIIVKFTDDFIGFAKEFNVDLTLNSNSYLGLCFYKDKGDITFILVKERGKYDWDTIAHESLHATNYILSNRGVGVSTDNDEAQTYLLGFIINKIQNYIK